MSATRITLPGCLGLDELARQLDRLVTELARHGVTHVVCPDFEALTVCARGEVELTPPDNDSPTLSARCYLEPDSVGDPRPVAITDWTGFGAARIAVTAPDAFRWSAPDPDGLAAYRALGERWDLTATELKKLSRGTCAIQSPWDLIGIELTDGFSLSEGDRLQLYCRIADTARTLMGTDAVVAAWLRGPYPMTTGTYPTPLQTLLAADWRRASTLALALEAHVERRQAAGDTAPRALAAGFDRILWDPGYTEETTVTVEEALHHQVENGPASRADFGKNRSDAERQILGLARHADRASAPLGGERP